MIELPQVTVIIADTKNHGYAIKAIKETLKQIKPAKTIFLTDRDFVDPEYVVIKIPAIKGKAAYSKLVVKDLYRYFDTDYCLLIQHDGYVLCGDVWDNDFLEYDYIGAPWNYPDENRNVGNGGFSLRSKKLQSVLGGDDTLEIIEPEDEIIGRLYRRYLENCYGVRFAPEDLAHKFSFELHEPKDNTFGFHAYFWKPYQETVVVKREASLGDVVQTEAILHYFHNKGYRVVLDTLPQFYSLFQNHYFPVEYYEMFNKNVRHTVVNLDMSYESDPKKLHLKAYYEFAGVPESEQVIRNPKLNFVVDKSNTLFPDKYVVLHLDKRAQGGRNIYGVDWSYVVCNYLQIKGYTVFQIGKGESEETGAIKMNTLAEPMMAYLLAGCELFIGIDSGPANVAVALGRKAIIFHGNVDPDYIWPDRTNIRVITNHTEEEPICNTPYCWHSVIGCEGVKCYVDESKPPCAQFETYKVIDAIEEML
jgi:ADP-heptose:LPS heptosyltransferase